MAVNPLKFDQLSVDFVNQCLAYSVIHADHILGMITDVDERSTAMEARAFGATPKPTSLIIVPDPVGERVARWLMFLSAITVVVLVVVGVIA